MAPFVIWRQLGPHKKKFLARMRIHVSQQQTEIGKLLPPVSGHLGQERALPVDYLVVGDGENEVFRVLIEHGKSEGVVMKTAVNGVLTEI
jgi:hypothetical protein